MSPKIGTRAKALDASFRSLPIDPEAVKVARDFAGDVLGDLATTDTAHADDVRVVVSELVTNAIKYGAGGRTNVNVEIGIWSLWTLVTVDDRDPQVYDEPGPASGELDESGRGLFIVRAYAERFWWDRKQISKTANAVICRTGITLTDEDQAILDDLENA